MFTPSRVEAQSCVFRVAVLCAASKSHANPLSTLG